MMRLIIILIILSSCSNYGSKKIEQKEIIIDKNLSFNEFKNKMLIYGKISNYPNINE
tara:strand:- start:91 stop:261 length:171 start_codon:yes stop_codon:yes gene_type:complete